MKTRQNVKRKGNIRLWTAHYWEPISYELIHTSRLSKITAGINFISGALFPGIDEI